MTEINEGTNVAVDATEEANLLVLGPVNPTAVPCAVIRKTSRARGVSGFLT